MQRALPMKCGSSSLVSNDNIKQIYGHVTHTNGKGERKHRLLRYTVCHQAKHRSSLAVFFSFVQEQVEQIGEEKVGT